MKKSAALILVAAALLSLGFQTAPAGWQRFTSEEGRFSVLMPGADAPRLRTNLRTDPRVGTYSSAFFTKKADKGFFTAGWVDYASGVSLDAQAELRASRDNFIKGVKARPVSERPVTLEGHPGLEFTAESGQAVFKSRVYVVGTRAYLLTAVTYKGFDDAANVNAFFSSFQLRRDDR